MQHHSLAFLKPMESNVFISFWRKSQFLWLWKMGGIQCSTSRHPLINSFSSTPLLSPQSPAHTQHLLQRVGDPPEQIYYYLKCASIEGVSIFYYTFKKKCVSYLKSHSTEASTQGEDNSTVRPPQDCFKKKYETGKFCSSKIRTLKRLHQYRSTLKGGGTILFLLNNYEVNKALNHLCTTWCINSLKTLKKRGQECLVFYL